MDLPQVSLAAKRVQGPSANQPKEDFKVNLKLPMKPHTKSYNRKPHK